MFASLYEEHVPAIYGYLVGFAASDEEAADLTQEVFVRAFESRHRYQDRGVPPIVWLIRIARNAATDAHRRRRPTVSFERLVDEIRPLREPSAEASALAAEEVELLDVLLARLPPKHRHLLALRFGSELSCAQIASIVGKSERAVRKQIERSLHRLKEEYSDRYVE